MNYQILTYEVIRQSLFSKFGVFLSKYKSFEFYENSNNSKKFEIIQLIELYLKVVIN